MQPLKSLENKNVFLLGTLSQEEMIILQLEGFKIHQILNFKKVAR